MMPDTPADLAKHQQVLEKIAKKLAPEYGIGPQEFTITIPTESMLRFASDGARSRWLQPKGVKIEGGIYPHIIFKVWLDDPEFEYWLRDALQQLEIVKRCGAIDVRSRLNERDALVRELIPYIVDRPLLDGRDIEVRLSRRVTITHKRTGMISTREAPEGKVTWTKLIRLANQELFEYVEVADRMRKDKRDLPLAAIIGTHD